jgi:putative tryptophan/tyrosine transport system substrate-binding protein
MGTAQPSWPSLHLSWGEKLPIVCLQRGRRLLTQETSDFGGCALRLPGLLVRRRVAVLVAAGTVAALAAKPATTTVPIVFSAGGDPVALGLVASLSRPGGNLTGIANLSAELNPKQLQLLRAVIRNATRFGVLADLAFPGIQSTIADLQGAARTLGLQLIVEYARTDSDLEPAFASFSQAAVTAVRLTEGTISA